MKKIKTNLITMFIILITIAFSGCGETEFKNTLTRISSETTYSFAYTGEAIGPSIAGTETGDEVYYALLPSGVDKPTTIEEVKENIDFVKLGKGSATELGLVDVGTYTIYYAVIDGKEFAYGEFVLTITQGINQWTTTPAIEDWTYNETSSTPQGTCENGTVVFEYKLALADDSTYTTTKPTNAGSYKMRATVKDTNYIDLIKEVDFEITKATNQWTTTPAIEDWTNNETSSTPQGACENGTVVFEYKLALADDSTYTTTKPTNAGSYKMRATVKDTNYIDLIKEVDFEITKATNQWTTTPAIEDWTYNETSSTPQGVCENGTVVFEYKLALADDSTYTTTKPTNAGSYKMRATVKDTNYTDLSNEVDFEIFKATNQWSTIPAITGWAYGETANEPAGACENGSVVFEYKLANADDSKYTTTKPTTTGTYKVRASVTGQANYNDLVMVFDLEIGQAIDCDLYFYQYNETTEQFEEVLFGDPAERIQATYDTNYNLEYESELDNKVIYLLSDVSSASDITLAMLTQEKIRLDSVKITGTMYFAIKPQSLSYNIKYIDFDENEIASINVETGGGSIYNSSVEKFQYTENEDVFLLGWTLTADGTGPMFERYDEFGYWTKDIGTDVVLYAQKHQKINVSVTNYPSLSYVIDSRDFSFSNPCIEGLYFFNYTLGKDGIVLNEFEDFKNLITNNELSVYMNYIELISVEKNDPIIGEYKYVESNALANYLHLVDTSSYSEFCTWAHNYDANHYFGKLYYYLTDDNLKQYVVQKNNFSIEKLNYNPATATSLANILYNARNATPFDDKIPFIICELSGNYNTKIETLKFLEIPTNATEGFDLTQLVDHFVFDGVYYVYELTDGTKLFEDEEDFKNYTTYSTHKINKILFSKNQQKVWTLNLGKDYSVTLDSYTYYRMPNNKYYQPITIPEGKNFMGWLDTKNYVMGSTPNSIIGKYLSHFDLNDCYELESGTFDLIPVFKDNVIDYSNKEFIYDSTNDKTKFICASMASIGFIDIDLKLNADGTYSMSVEMFGQKTVIESNYYMVNNEIIAINTGDSRSPYYIFAEYKYNTIFIDLFGSKISLTQSTFEDDIVGKYFVTIQNVEYDAVEQALLFYPNGLVSIKTMINNKSVKTYGVIEVYGEKIYKITSDDSVFYLKYFNEANTTEYYIMYSDSTCENIINVFVDMKSQRTLSGLGKDYINMAGIYTGEYNYEYISFMGGHLVEVTANWESRYCIYKRTGEGTFNLLYLGYNKDDNLSLLERTFKYENGYLIETTYPENASYKKLSFYDVKDLNLFNNATNMSDFIDYISGKSLQDCTFTENCTPVFGKKQLLCNEITLQDTEISVSYTPDTSLDTPETYVGKLQLAFDFQTRDIMFFGTLTSSQDANLTIALVIEYDEDMDAFEVNIDGIAVNFIEN